MKKREGLDWRWLVVIVLAVLGFVAAGWYAWSWYTARPVFTYVKVERGPMRVTLRESALVSPEHRLNIMPPIPGRMDTILVANGEAVRQGQVLAWISSTSRAALMDAARAQGGKELTYWEDVFKPAPLVAPLDGHIISTAVVPGQVVVTAQPIFTMSDHLIVEAFLDETDLSQTWLGQHVDMTFDSFPDAHLTGKVHEIAYDATTVNNVTTYQVNIYLDNTPAYVRSGVSANVFLLISDKKNVLKIPTDAISPEGTVLVAQGADQPLEERKIELGQTDGEYTEVKSGLVEGDWVAERVFNIQKADSAGFSFTAGMNNMHHH
ncbi:MAG TPA: HlyD family efflux transporter periplasmic adaptor subunit [Candidatus Methylacidiphilales bacterium]|jgi:macrolide-specific efflux system membrane fusion protein|nr:HlyD family efflux transporter periplasmic adaptor subunit [Candidatus Methylacidiphilales bacterium]